MKEALRWHVLITGPDEARAFVKRCGFCTWGPVLHLPFPNLAQAMGETATSVLERIWVWKDDLHFAQQLSSGKLIAGQSSFLAPDSLPDFISALVGRGLEHERDVSRLYFDGRLSGEAKVISEWLLDHRVQPRRELRHEAGRTVEEAGERTCAGGAATPLPGLQSGPDGSHARHVLLPLGTGRALLTADLC